MRSPGQDNRESEFDSEPEPLPLERLQLVLVPRDEAPSADHSRLLPVRRQRRFDVVFVVDESDENVERSTQSRHRPRQE